MLSVIKNIAIAAIFFIHYTYPHSKSKSKSLKPRSKMTVSTAISFLNFSASLFSKQYHHFSLIPIYSQLPISTFLLYNDTQLRHNLVLK